MERFEQPVLALLKAMHETRSRLNRYLPQEHLVSLPAGESALRGTIRRVQSMLESRDQFGWQWRKQNRLFLQQSQPVPAETLAMSYLPLMSVYQYAMSRYFDKPVPIEEHQYDVIGEGVPPVPSVNVAPTAQSGTPIRLVSRAYDAPLTRMDNIRRSRVLTRLMDSGRERI
jgi:hypothetical protein